LNVGGRASELMRSSPEVAALLSTGSVAGWFDDGGDWRMVDPRFNQLVEQLENRRIDRRNFLVRAAALGASATAIGAALSRAQPVFAQDATPAGPQSRTEIGQPGIEHITDTSKGTIKLYSSWPLTGASEQIGGDAVESIKMAFEDRGNAAGGFALTYEALDDGIAAKNGAWDAGKEAENSNKVINDPDAMVYMATYNSGAAQIAIPILNQVQPAGMAMISYANTAVQLTKEYPTNEEGFPDKLYPSGKRNYMRVVPADDIQGAASANWAFTSQGKKRAYVLHDNQVYGKGVATVFANSFQELGGEVIGNEPYDPEAPEYGGLMDGIAAESPDILYLGAIVNLNASKLLQDMRDRMSVDDVMFLGPDGLINQAFVDGAGDAAQDAYITFAGLPPQQLTGAGADWYQAIKERLGHEPDAYAVYAYECAVAVVQAIDSVGEKDRGKILDALWATEGFDGLLGTWSFTETGDTSATTMSLNKVIDGVITFQEDIAPASAS
jgi:branched-chain amino acid transport system substrate-binding protein